MFKRLCVLFTLFTSSCFAQETINVYTRFPASDTTALLTITMIKELNDKLKDRYEFKINVIPGAGGESADQRALIEANLGRKVIVSGTMSNFTLNPLLYQSKIDRDAEFIPLELIATLPNAFMVSENSGINSLEDFVRNAKNKTQIFNGITIQAISPKLLDAIFRNHFELNNVKSIPYKLPGDITKSLIIREVDYTFQNPIDTPGLKLIFLSSPKRSKFFPDVPTALELGIPELNYVSTIMMYMPIKNIDFHREISSIVHQTCQSEEMNKISNTIKVDLACEKDIVTLRNEIQRQRILVEKYKDSIK